MKILGIHTADSSVGAARKQAGPRLSIASQGHEGVEFGGACYRPITRDKCRDGQYSHKWEDRGGVEHGELE
jgi:hypothetical protein